MKPSTALILGVPIRAAALVIGIVAAGAASAGRVYESIPVSGLWLDTERAAQGLMLEQIDPPWGAPDDGLPRVIVSWFTWAPEEHAEPGPRWMFGVGRRAGDRIRVQLDIAVAGDSPYRTPSGSALLAPWGSAEIRFQDQNFRDANLAVVDFLGPPGWGSGTRSVAQLTMSGSGIPYDMLISPPYPGELRPSGVYSDPTRTGQGWALSMYPRWDIESILLWFTFDAEGRPSWLVGIDPGLEGGSVFAMLRAASGGTFEGGTPHLEAAETLMVSGAAGPPTIIDCGSVGRISVLGEFPPDRQPVFQVNRITRLYDPHLAHPPICSSSR